MRVNLFRGLLLFILSLAIFSCSQQDKMEIEKAASAFDIKQGEAAVKQSNQNFIKSFQASDSSEIAQSFTKDAQLLCANHAPIEGRKKIGHYFSEMIRQGSTDVKLNSMHIWGDSTILVEEGNYLLMDKNGDQTDKGSYIALWQQESGNWKIFRDIWVSSIPKSVIKIDSTNIKH
jgi:ketosteroid isomerase-like protein